MSALIRQRAGLARFFLAALVTALLAACGGGDAGSGANSAGSSSPSTGSSAPPSGTGGASGGSPQALGVLVPAYFDASGKASPWSTLSLARQDFPGVPITAILNPDNGPSGKAIPAFTSAIADFTAKDGKVAGYVETDKGGRALSAAEADVDAYMTFYKPYISGIFLDEMSASTAQLTYYQSLAAYIRNTYPGTEIIGNPGTYPAAGYAAVADTLVVFENPASMWGYESPQPDSPWVYQRASDGQAVMATDASCTQMQTIFQAAHSTLYNTGWVYATDLSESANPWGALPSYWTTLLGTVSAIDQGQALPAC